MSTSFYDVLIAGTELPGLILGALCAKKGYRVLVIGQGCRRNDYTHGNHVFRRRPQLITGLDSSPTVRHVLSELSLSLEMRNRPTRCDPSYQVITPDRRVDVSANAEELERELEREFPDDLRAIRTVHRSLETASALLGKLLERNPPLPPDGWTEKRDYQRLTADLPALVGAEPLPDPLGPFPPGHPYRAIATGPVLMASGMDLEDSSVLPLSRVAAHLAEGVYWVDGGVEAFKDIFVQKLRQHASDYRPDIALDGLLLRRGKVAEGYVRDRRESIGCNLLICNSDLKRFFKLVPAEHQKERYHHGIHTLQPTHYLFTVNIAMATAGLPEGLSKTAFIIGDPRRSLSDENLLLAQFDRGPLPEGKSAQAAGLGTTVVTVSCRLRTRSMSPSVSFVREMTHRVLVRLRESVLPFLDEHLLAVHSPWIASDPMTGEQRFDPGELIPIYRGAYPNTLDASVLPVQTEYKNILVCGDPIFSGFGLEGSFLAALNAFRRVSERVVKKTLLS